MPASHSLRRSTSPSPFSFSLLQQWQFLVSLRSYFMDSRTLPDRTGAAIWIYDNDDDDDALISLRFRNRQSRRSATLKRSQSTRFFIAAGISSPRKKCFVLRTHGRSWESRPRLNRSRDLHTHTCVGHRSVAKTALVCISWSPWVAAQKVFHTPLSLTLYESCTQFASLTL